MNIKTEDEHKIITVVHRPPNAKSICILAHGITADKTEGGIFDRLASSLHANGVATLQFDYRGHGQSNIPSTEMTIAGQIADLSEVISACGEYDRISLVAASFGAVSTGLLPPNTKDQLEKICLWNPVLDLRATFVEPELPWQKENFGKSRIDAVLSGRALSLLIDGTFAVGNKFLGELEQYDIVNGFKEFKNPMLILHGDKDTYVSYTIAQNFSRVLDNTDFVTVSGSEHGFGRREDELFVIQQTVHFISDE